MRRQRGSIGFYIVAGIVGAALVSGLIYSYNEGQQARADLDTCKTNYQALEGRLEEQNKAVDDLKADVKKRKDAAAAAAKAAKAGQVAADAEIARLKGAKGKDCTQAVGEVRKGLGK